MIRLHETRTIARSLQDCFRYLADFSTIEQWDPGVYRAVKRTPGPPQVGSEFDLILNSGGRRVPMTYRTLRQEPNQCLEFEGISAQVRAKDVISFRALSEQETEVDYVAELTFSGSLARAEWALGPWLKRVGVKAVEGMKHALEEGGRVQEETVWENLSDHLILPAAWEFTERGYLKMPNKGLSDFMDGKTVLITGPTSGIGQAAATEFARLGAKLILVGRDRARLMESERRIRESSGARVGMIRTFEAELTLQSEVKRVAAEIRAATPTLDVLIHNAGALFQQREETSEGHEKTVAIHVLAPWLLTHELLPSLKAARGRVIFVSSGGMYTQTLQADDLESRAGAFDGVKAYAQMKRAQVLLAEHWAEEWRSDGVSVHSMHPGWAATPGVARSLPGFNRVMERYLRDSRMGADTVVWLGSSPEVAAHSGKFWFDRKPRPTELLKKDVQKPETLRKLVRKLSSNSAQ